MTETWKDVVGYEKNYEVSNEGKVRNKRYGEILRPQINNKGYKRVQLHQNGKMKNVLVHRLVAIAFIENPDNLPLVDHIDRNITNNHASNLRWCTRSENQHNKTKMQSNTSGFKGVTWDKGKRKWRAQIRLNGKTKHLGLFNTPEEAAAAYNGAAEMLHGEFACLNEILPRKKITIIKKTIIEIT